LFDEKGHISSGIVRQLKGWPEGLDNENLELEFVFDTELVCCAGGDWQQMIWFRIQEKNGELVICDLYTGDFEDGHKQDKKQYKDNIDAILDSVLKESIIDFDNDDYDIYNFAKEQHDKTGKTRKHSKQPYWEHPEGVAKIVKAYEGTPLQIK
jgi:hypothetical protein